MSPNNKAQLVSATAAYMGPLPSADQLIKYKDAQADAPERIIKMAEIQAAHRQTIEKRVIRGDNLRSTMGLVLAFVIVMTAIYSSWNLITAGHDVAGASVFGATVASVVTSFIYGSSAKRAAKNP